MGLIVLLIVSASVMAGMLFIRWPDSEDRSIASYRSTLDTIGGVAERARRADLDDPASALQQLSADEAGRRINLKRPLVAIVGVALVASLGSVVAQNVGTSNESSAAPQATAPSTSASTTTTTPPPTAPPEVAPVSADDQEVVFSVGPSVSLVVVATGRCWVAAQNEDSPGGGRHELFQGTLEPGSQQPIEGPAPLRVRLGSPTAVDVMVDGVPAQVPAQDGTPIDLVFQAA